MKESAGPLNIEYHEATLPCSQMKDLIRGQLGPNS